MIWTKMGGGLKGGWRKHIDGTKQEPKEGACLD